MKQLRALVYKEWRDQRALALGTLALCALLVVVARVVFGARFDAQFREATILPGCLGAFAVALAVETVARDKHGRVDETLERLPASAHTTWIAKLGFLLLASIGCLAALVLLETGILLAEKRPLSAGLLTMYQPRWWLAIAATAASCHACASVLRSSLPSALLGIALVIGVPLLASWLPIGRATEIVDLVLASWTPEAIAALLCFAFLLGSLLAQRVRRPDSFGWRRAAAAVLGVGFVLGPAFANSARLGDWAFDIAPFSKSARVDCVVPGPDGRHVAIQVSQIWTPRRDWLPLTGSRTGKGCRVRHEIWILDTATGEVQEIDDRFRSFASGRQLDPQGRLVTVSTPGSFGDGDYTAERIDLSTATVVAAHPESESDSLDYRYGFERWLEESHDGDQRVLSWRGKDGQLRLPLDVLCVPSPEPGVVFHQRGSALVRHELEGDVTRRIADPFDRRDAIVEVSPDGRFLRLRQESGERVLDARDGRTLIELPEKARLRGWCRNPGRVGFVITGQGEWRLLHEDGGLTMLPTRAWSLCEFGADSLLVSRQCSVESVKLDGSESQVLYQSRP